MSEAEPALYHELAEWWPLFSAPADYADEAALIAQFLREHARRDVRDVLELGSGGGNNASHLKDTFTLTLVDLSADMIAVSRSLNPGCEHVQGDMRTIRLGREFDAVFVHDAIMYMLTRDDLVAAARTARVHCRRGGVALFVPDCTRETFVARTGTGGHDSSSDGRAVRYLEWLWDPDPGDGSYLVDFAILLRAHDGSIRSITDRHAHGCFDRAVWHEVLREAGFDDVRTTREPASVDWTPRELFVGVVDER